MATTAESLKEILMEKFSVPEEKIRPDTTLDSLGLDSLDLIEVLFEVEDKFNIRIPQDGATIKATSIQDLLDTVTQLVEEQPAASEVSQA